MLASNVTRVAQSAVPTRLVQFAGWFALGVLAFAFELGLLAILHQWLGMHLWQASLIAAEIVLLCRFFSTDRLVFGHKKPTLDRCVRFHIAAAGSFTVSWLVLNSTAHTLGVPYPVATFFGSAAACVWSALTNFFWVWRTR